MISDSADRIQLSPVRLDDVDLFSESEIGLGWDIESTQLSAGASTICFDHFASPEFLVGRFTSEKSMQNSFSPPDGVVVFLICRAKLPVFWNGQHLPPNLMGIVRSGREHFVVLPDGWDCYEFMMSEDLIRRTELFPPDFFARTNDLKHAHVPLVEPVTGWFLETLDALFEQPGLLKGSSAATVARSELSDVIIDGLQLVVDAGLGAQGWQRPRPARRFDLVNQGREILLAQLDADISLDDLAQSLGVSYRVLNYAFQDTLGVSPYQYMLTERLHAVRRLLKSSDISVTDACIAYGFSTPSRFTRQYSRLFGELPSATRRPRPLEAA